MNAFPELTFRTQWYQPGTDLDEQLADLGYACVHGWPDQRPITAGLVRSRLNTHPTPDCAAAHRSIVITGRDSHNRLVAAVAVRPPTPIGPGRLWGPLVHPDHQGQGLGLQLLDRAQSHLDHIGQPGLSTSEIPDCRTRAWASFASAGWSKSATLQLFKGPLPLKDENLESLPLTAHFGGSCAAVDLIASAERQLTDLYALCHPDTGRSIAEATHARWSADERFSPDCALTVGTTDRMIAAVLVYPLAATTASQTDTEKSEPTEALIGDLLIDPNLPRAAAQTVAQKLVLTALNRAHHHHSAQVARALIDRHHAVGVNVLTACGLRATELFHSYRRNVLHIANGG